MAELVSGVETNARDLLLWFLPNLKSEQAIQSMFGLDNLDLRQRELVAFAMMVFENQYSRTVQDTDPEYEEWGIQVGDIAPNKCTWYSTSPAGFEFYGFDCDGKLELLVETDRFVRNVVCEHLFAGFLDNYGKPDLLDAIPPGTEPYLLYKKYGATATDVGGVTQLGVVTKYLMDKDAPVTRYARALRLKVKGNSGYKTMVAKGPLGYRYTIKVTESELAAFKAACKAVWLSKVEEVKDFLNKMGFPVNNVSSVKAAKSALRSYFKAWARNPERFQLFDKQVVPLAIASPSNSLELLTSKFSTVMSKGALLLPDGRMTCVVAYLEWAGGAVASPFFRALKDNPSVCDYHKFMSSDAYKKNFSSGWGEAAGSPQLLGAFVQHLLAQPASKIPMYLKQIESLVQQTSTVRTANSSWNKQNLRKAVWAIGGYSVPVNDVNGVADAIHRIRKYASGLAQVTPTQVRMALNILKGFSSAQLEQYY